MIRISYKKTSRPVWITAYFNSVKRASQYLANLIQHPANQDRLIVRWGNK